jgi:GDP-mannose 6-dehydrogenase
MVTSLSVFGLGYVGCVSAACFARQGFDVVGVDVSPAKVDMVNAGKSTIVEEGIGELVADMRVSGRLSATTDVAEAVHATSVSLVAVGDAEPPERQHRPALIERGASRSGRRCATRTQPPAGHTVVIRSTVMPGTIDSVAIPAIERASARRTATGSPCAATRKFLREDVDQGLLRPPFTLVGAHDPAHAEPCSRSTRGSRRRRT